MSSAPPRRADGRAPALARAPAPGRAPAGSRARWLARLAGPAALAAVLASCTAGQPTAVVAPAHASGGTSATGGTARARASTPAAGRPARSGTGGAALPRPAALPPFTRAAAPGAGTWRAAGRPVHGMRAVYETRLVPPGGTGPAGIAWMDTRLLAARLYSGSLSPGGGPYRYTAPVQPAQAATLVAAFNGGFQMKDAGGGYYTEGRTVVPLRRGAASLVISVDGSVTVGAWGQDVSMGPGVVSVRQNLVLLVAGGRPTAQAASADWRAWGNTCGAASCAATVPGIDHQWRSGVGVTTDGALVYAAGPGLDPLQLAQLLARAGVVRGMELDINPDWPVFASYDPPGGQGPAAPANGSKLLGSTVQGPWTFFEAAWARDFITMSARG
ncbi:MAG: phosphodiester glycosidase family protein [Streptosporangiales bacterium]